MSLITDSTSMWFICPNPDPNYIEKLEIFAQIANKNYGEKLHGIVVFTIPQKVLFIGLFTGNDILDTMRKSALTALVKKKKDIENGVDPKLIVPEDPLLYLYTIDHDHEMIEGYGEKWDFNQDTSIIYIFPKNLVLPDVWNNIPINIANNDKSFCRLNGSIESWFYLPSPRGDLPKEIGVYCRLAEERYSSHFRASVIFKSTLNSYFIATFLTSGSCGVLFSSMRNAMDKYETSMQYGNFSNEVIPEDPLLMLYKIDPAFKVLGLRGQDWELPEDLSIFYFYPENLVFPEEWDAIYREKQ